MTDKRLVALSALQHYDFCPRQCALIHNEQAWAENFLTAKGQQLHQRVDSGEPEQRKGIRYERGVQVSAPKLGVVGKLDLLEIELATGKLTPIEYKRGKSKATDCDRIQLCAQALCLEEMLDTQIDNGALWYWQTRRREIVALDETLRLKTQQTIKQVQAMLDQGITPKPVYGKHCNACSLRDLCLPNNIANDKSKAYIDDLFNEE